MSISPLDDIELRRPWLSWSDLDRVATLSPDVLATFLSGLRECKILVEMEDEDSPREIFNQQRPRIEKAVGRDVDPVLKRYIASFALQATFLLDQIVTLPEGGYWDVSDLPKAELVDLVVKTAGAHDHHEVWPDRDLEDLGLS